MKMKVKLKNASQRKDINRPKPREIDTNILNIKCVSV